MSEGPEVVAHDLTRELPVRVSERGAIGARLASARAAQGLTVEQIAYTLLLSNTQVQGLEEGHPRAFHNEQFYQQGLRKYAVLVRVHYDAPAPARPSKTVRDHRVAIAAPREETQRRGRVMAAAFAVVALAGAGWAVWVHTGPAQSATASTALPIPASPFIAQPSADVAEPAAVPADGGLGVEATAPAATAAPLAVSPGSPYGRIESGTTTWVFVRYANGEVVEETLTSGERFVIEAVPKYLAVGAPDIRLIVRDREVDITPWIRNGALRIGSRDFELSALAPD